MVNEIFLEENMTVVEFTVVDWEALLLALLLCFALGIMPLKSRARHLV